MVRFVVFRWSSPHLAHSRTGNDRIDQSSTPPPRVAIVISQVDKDETLGGCIQQSVCQVFLRAYQRLTVFLQNALMAAVLMVD